MFDCLLVIAHAGLCLVDGLVPSDPAVPDPGPLLAGNRQYHNSD